jgi:hypothetical protein
VVLWCPSRATPRFPNISKRDQANLKKIQATLTLLKPTKLHEIQQLAGQVAALRRFIARLGEKALPFYALMKKLDKKIEGIEEVD